MDNNKGQSILSAVFNGMAYPNKILTSEEDNILSSSYNSNGIDVKDLHKIWLRREKIKHYAQLFKRKKHLRLPFQSTSTIKNLALSNKVFIKPVAVGNPNKKNGHKTP